MKILVLTYHFTPDLGAGAFRNEAFVSALSNELEVGDDVHVLTTLPNRYDTYSIDAPNFEYRDNVTIERIFVRKHLNTIGSQIFAFLQYAIGVLRITSKSDYDIVFASSSKLMTAFLGAFIARRKRAALFLDIRDIFLEVVDDVFAGWKGALAKATFVPIEKYAMSKADHINLVSEGFKGYFFDKYPDRVYSFFTNGVDPEVFDEISLRKTDRKKDTARYKNNRAVRHIVYAGNIGSGQALASVVPNIASSLNPNVHFTILGDGLERESLIRSLEELGVADLVSVKPAVRREEVAELYSQADVLFLHLGKEKAFERVLPSKIFEYAATGKPILAGVSGFSANFLESEVENVAIFPPSDAVAAVDALKRLSMSNCDRSGFVKKYSRSNIARRMAIEVRSLSFKH